MLEQCYYSIKGDVMFENNFFDTKKDTEISDLQNKLGTMGEWGLHIAKVSFLIYSGYHGISAASSKTGSTPLAMGAQIFGIITLEITLLSLYVAWHNHRITGTSQSLAAGVTYIIGFILACLGVVADSQLHEVGQLTPILLIYVTWLLPVAPAIMAIGALLTHELAPIQIRTRNEAREKDKYEQEEFDLNMASQRAQRDMEVKIAQMQLQAKYNGVTVLAEAFASDNVRESIAQTATANLPALLSAIGVNLPQDSQLPEVATVHQEITATEPTITAKSDRATANFTQAVTS